MRSPRKLIQALALISMALSFALPAPSWAQNAPPVITAPATITAQEGVFFSVTITATAQDPSATVILTGPSPFCGISFSSSPGVGQATGTLSGTPGFTCAGSYALTFTASDGVSVSSTTVMMTILNTDRAPIVTAPATINTNENVLVTFTVSAVDPDGDPITSLTASSSPPTTGSTFTANASNTSGTFSWTPSFIQAGTYTVTFTASNALSGTARTIIAVCNGCERAPVVVAPASASGGTGTLITFTVTAADPDGDAINSLIASGTAVSAGGTFTAGAGNTSGTFTWTPSAGQVGSYLATFTASNALAGSAATQITVTGDGPPVVTAPPTAGIRTNVAGSFVVTATDPDGDPIASLTSASSPSTTGSTFTTNASNTSGTFAWTPTNGQLGTYSITFTASNALTGSARTALTVCDCPFISIIAPASISLPAGSPIIFIVSASDPGGETITSFTASGSAISAGGVFSTNASFTSGTFNWTPTTSQGGTYSVTFTASNSNRSGIATTQITVTGGVASARAFVTNSGKTIKLNSGKPSWCVHVEPSSGSFQLSDIQLGTVVLRSPGTGSVPEVPAITGKTNVQGDVDNNGIDDAEFCFAKGNLQLLFSNLSGHNTVGVTIAGRLMSGIFFEAPLSVDVNAGGGGNPAASITPNPLNPSGVLTFGTLRSGAVRVRIFDSGGRLVRTVLDTALPAGPHDVPLDARDAVGRPFASGVYFYRVEAPGDVMTGRFVVAK